MSKITLLGLICTSLYCYEVLAREPCLQCVDSTKKRVCIADDSWTPTDAFSPRKSYDCNFLRGDVLCHARYQDSDEVCNSSTACGFKLDEFTQGTKCFIDMHEGISAHTTIAPSGGNKAQIDVTAGTCQKCTETWLWPFICMVIGSVICVLALIILFKTGHIEWKSKKDKKKENENTSQTMKKLLHRNKENTGAGGAETHKGAESDADEGTPSS